MMTRKKHCATVKNISTYANATEVLPTELIEAIQQYHTGVLYVPSISSYHNKRKRFVLALVEKGVSTKEIGRIAGISPRRVRQIVNEAAIVDDGDFNND